MLNDIVFPRTAGAVTLQARSAGVSLAHKPPQSLVVDSPACGDALHLELGAAGLHTTSAALS